MANIIVTCFGTARIAMWGRESGWEEGVDFGVSDRRIVNWDFAVGNLLTGTRPLQLGCGGGDLGGG